jgi:hypothetical protein
LQTWPRARSCARNRHASGLPAVPLPSFHLRRSPPARPPAGFCDGCVPPSKSPFYLRRGRSRPLPRVCRTI